MTSGLIMLLMLSFSTPMKPAATAVPAKEIFYRHSPKANLIFYVDTGSMGNHIFRSFKVVGNMPAVKNNPAIQKSFNRTVKNFQRMLQQAKKRYGVNPLKAVRYISGSLRLSKKKEEILIVLGGNIPLQTINILKKENRFKGTTKQIGQLTVYIPNNLRRHPTIGWSPAGQVLVGTKPAVLEAAKHDINQNIPAGSLVNRMLKRHTTNNLMTLSFRLPPQAKKDVARELKLGGRILNLFNGLKAAHASFQFTGAQATVWTNSAQHAKSYKQFTDGIAKLLLGAEHGVNAFLKLADALLDAKDPHLPGFIRKVLKYKKPIFAEFYKRFSGKGLTYKLSTNAQHAVNFKMVSKSGSVIPVMMNMIVPGAFGFLLFAKSPSPARAIPRATTAVKVAPATKRVAPQPAKRAPTPQPVQKP